MDGFSSASVSSSCAAISGRARSVASVIDDFLKRVEPSEISEAASDFGPQNLLFLATKLRQFSQHADQLCLCLNDDPHVSHSLQEIVSRYIPACDVSLVLTEEQVKRLSQPHDISRVDPVVISQFQDVLVSYSRLFIFVSQLLTMSDPASQDSKLANGDGLRLVANAETSAALVMSNGNIFRGGGLETGNPGSEAVAAAETDSDEPAGTAAVNDEPPSAAALRTRKTGFAKGFSSLTSSFKAMTASIRPRPEPLVSPLCQAASRGNISQIKGLLAQGANINGRNEDGNTSLICAIISHQPETVRFLLSTGASYSTRDFRKRRPPLFHALSRSVEDLEIAKILLENGASLGDKNLVGQPFFVDLVLSERLDPIRLCLEHGADPNAKDLTNRSILSHATSRANLDLVRLLLQHGASPNDKDILGNTLLLSTIRNDKLPQDDKTALISLLLGNGAKPDEPDSWGLTALAHAAAADNRDLLTILLSHGADPNRIVHGDSLLVNAIDSSKWDQVWLLVEAGRADVNRADDRGRTPLAVALQRQNPDIVRLLLDRGADASRAEMALSMGLTTASHDRDVARLLMEQSEAAGGGGGGGNYRERAPSLGYGGVPSNSPSPDGRARLQRRSRTGSRVPSVSLSQSPPPGYRA